MQLVTFALLLLQDEVFDLLCSSQRELRCILLRFLETLAQVSIPAKLILCLGRRFLDSEDLQLLLDGRVYVRVISSFGSLIKLVLVAALVDCCQSRIDWLSSVMLRIHE